MIQDIPIISINVKVLKFLSIIIEHNWKRYVILGLCISFNCMQFWDMYYSNQPIEEKIKNLYSLALWGNSILRGVVVSVQHKKYEQFMEKIGILYYDLEKRDEDEIKTELKKTTIFARRFSLINIFLGLFVYSCFAIYALLTPERVLPYGVDIPGIPKEESPYYEILFVYQMIIGPLGVCMYIPFTNLVVCFIMFAIVMSKALQYRLINLKVIDTSTDDIQQNAYACVKYHVQLISYVTTLNDLITYFSLFEFLTYGATICALLFLLNIVHGFGQMCIVCAYISMILIQILATYWFANEMATQNENIANAAYAAPWVDCIPSVKKAIMLVIFKAQNPLTIMVGNLYPMSLELFHSLLKTAYSFFTILRGLYE